MTKETCMRKSFIAQLVCHGFIAALCLIAVAPLRAQTPQDAKLKAKLAKRIEAVTKDLARREWTIDGVTREALLHIPAAAKTTPSPLVFAFHGHGGSMGNAAAMFHCHDLWPEAIVVYMQGLNTPGRLTDPEGKRPGWQSSPGAQGDRDLKFFDAVLASLKDDYNVDERRVYSTGHSNGGGFTYLLWGARGDVFAAVAPSAAAGPGPEWNKHLATLRPKPVMHLAGEQDPLVKYEWQQRGIETLRQVNGCDDTGKEWAKGCTIYASKSGTPVVTLIHSGGHNFPPDAAALFVKFFKEHAKP